jgi:hypothetical protein
LELIVVSGWMDKGLHLPLKVIILFSLPVCNSVKNSLVQSVPASTYMS